MPRFLLALKSIATGQAAENVVEAPSSAYSEAVALLQELASSIQHYVPDQAKTSVTAFLADKSQSELLFLTSILLTVLLFVIILPVSEALFGCDGSEAKEEEELSMSPSFLRMYKPGVGVVEVDVSDMAETPSLTGASSGDSTRSIGSYSMETIEESEEEGLEDDEDEDSIGEASEMVNSTEGLERVMFTEEEGVNDKVKYC
mmetsp:Transcript_13829/g.25010  ORF Transcript_13829/g.25010 Transcript_13829/m.25010 type:complete len:202 (+) Transcript_13829:137-742(+)|eukprot:CAMPEP_0201866452 /NCGR_PEP_ID=MMETSP0902-20130614/1046_1 /ASSEMBLY_ACC=CAM_ASM_000551 /TAXON_ID=420261 /ORGANISM="Thalassiosira antarctica, Strain CCMP982" /LENGTH=201 /DNA_ID=CAMNT_0048391437 /DNA_START=137 /DNA_END=742 /DNA_ORIENTATION=+